MSGHQPLAQIAELEFAILRALCAHTTSGTERRHAFRELAGYVWHEADHAVIYEAVTRVSGHNPKDWREALPAQTTRMGFPDLDWTIYLKPQGEVRPSLEELVGRLKAATTS